MVLLRVSTVLWPLFIFIPAVLCARQSPLDYYRLHFEKKEKHPLADTLFEKTVWHRKVSHLVIEEKRGYNLVTLLMIQPYPYNYKSYNYAIHYKYDNYAAAFEKYVWLDRFLRKNGVLRVTLDGSFIIEEKILFEGYDELLNQSTRDADGSLNP